MPIANVVFFMKRWLRRPRVSTLVDQNSEGEKSSQRPQKIHSAMVHSSSLTRKTSRALASETGCSIDTIQLELRVKILPRYTDNEPNH